MKKLLTTLTVLSLFTGAYAKLSPEATGYLKQGNEAAQGLRKEMDRVIEAYRNAPRGSEERAQLREEMGKLDCEIKALEDHLDKTEDKARTWCRGCGRCGEPKGRPRGFPRCRSCG